MFAACHNGITLVPVNADVLDSIAAVQLATKCPFLAADIHMRKIAQGESSIIAAADNLIVRRRRDSPFLSRRGVIIIFGFYAWKINFRMLIACLCALSIAEKGGIIITIKWSI